MNPKADPYATKLHKRVDALLLVLTVVIIALVLRTSARGGTHFADTLAFAQQPIWSTLAIFNSPAGSGVRALTGSQMT